MSWTGRPCLSPSPTGLRKKLFLQVIGELDQSLGLCCLVVVVGCEGGPATLLADLTEPESVLIGFVMHLYRDCLRLLQVGKHGIDDLAQPSRWRAEPVVAPRVDHCRILGGCYLLIYASPSSRQTSPEL